MTAFINAAKNVAHTRCAGNRIRDGRRPTFGGPSCFQDALSPCRRFFTFLCAAKNVSSADLYAQHHCVRAKHRDIENNPPTTCVYCDPRFWRLDEDVGTGRNQ